VISKRSHLDAAEQIATEDALQLGGLVRGPRAEFQPEFEWEAETGELQAVQRFGQGLALAHMTANDLEKFVERNIDRNGGDRAVVSGEIASGGVVVSREWLTA